MESFETILSAGEHTNSLGRSQEVYDIVKANPGRARELFDCIYAKDAWVRMRAIDTFEKLVRIDPSIAQPFTSALVNDLTQKDQPSIQWHLAQMFTQIELDDEQTQKALAWLKESISTTDVDWIVSVNVMKALLHFYDKGLAHENELNQLLTVQTSHHSKTVRKKALMFLGQSS